MPSNFLSCPRTISWLGSVAQMAGTPPLPNSNHGTPRPAGCLLCTRFAGDSIDISGECREPPRPHGSAARDPPRAPPLPRIHASSSRRARGVVLRCVRGSHSHQQGTSTGWRYGRPEQTVSATLDTPLLNFLSQLYTCCSDKHASPCIFILRWISLGFTPSLPKKRMTERCSSLVYQFFVFLHT